MTLDTNKGISRTNALLILGLASVVVYVMWHVPELSIALYPFRLFVTFVHEAGHGLAAIISGGRFIEFVVYPDGSGVALTSGGARWLILPAGYLGAALFGAVLFYLVNGLHITRSTAVVLGVAVVLITFLFAKLFSVAFIVGVLFGLVLVAIGLRLNRELNALLLNMLAILTGLNGVLDLVYLIQNDRVMISGEIRNDAAAFAAQYTPLLSGAFWAAVWAGIAIGMLGISAYFSIIHPLTRRRRRQDPLDEFV